MDYQTVCKFNSLLKHIFLCRFILIIINLDIFLVASLLNTEVKSKIPNVTLYKLYKILKSS